MRAGWMLPAVCVVAGAAWFALQSGGTKASHESAGPTSAPREEPPTLAGRLVGHVVRSDGSPAAGAQVTALRQGGTELASTVAASDGFFRFEGLVPGLYRVRSTDAEKLGVEGWASTGVLDLRLTLAPASDTLRVRVVDPAGSAVPRFDARLLLPKGYRELGVQTDGKLTVEDGAQPWTGAILEIWNARTDDDTGLGYAPVRIGPLDRAPSDLEVLLHEGPVLEGVVLGPQGPLVPGLEIELAPLERWWERSDRDLVDAGLASSPGALPQRLPFEGLKPKVRTDASGRFRAAFLRPGAVHELALDLPDGWRGIRRREVRVGEGPLEIRLRGASAVRVTVLDSDQEPVSGAYVRIFPAGDSGFDSLGEVQTDEHGVAEIGKEVMQRLDPDRTHKLVVNPNYKYEIVRDFQRWRSDDDLARISPPYFAEKSVDDWNASDTTIRLAIGHTVSGIVLDSKGQPVAGRSVGLCSPVGFGGYETSQDGRFEFRGVPAGVVYLGLDDGGDSTGIIDQQREVMWAASFGPQKNPPPAPSLVPEWRSLKVVADVGDVTLRIPATLSARLMLPPVPAMVDAKQKERRRRSFEATWVRVLQRTDKGWEHFRLETPGFSTPDEKRFGPRVVRGLLPGRTYAAWMTPIEGQYVYAEFRAEVGELVLERKPGAAIRGRILDRPRDSSRVRLSVQDDRARSMPTATPDSEGGFQVSGLPESTWTVHAWCRAADDVVWRAEGKVKTGDEVQLRLAPEPEKPGK